MKRNRLKLLDNRTGLENSISKRAHNVRDAGLSYFVFLFNSVMVISQLLYLIL